MDSSEEAGEQSLMQHFIDPATDQRAEELFCGSTAHKFRGQHTKGEKGRGVK